MDAPLILDRYRPLADLASGGFGDVVLAYDTRMQRRVAIKRLPFPRDRAGRVVAPTGLAEARTAAMLNHPAIVTVHEWDTDSDEAFLIMEYVEGASLADLLDDGPLDTDQVAAVLVAVSSALTYAHDNGVLHLDIKPENVLVTRDGIVKVTDFGVASLSTSSGHQSTLGGTLGYMPLEQLRDEDVDERTDVWALATLIFELLTEANPMGADTIEGAIFKASVIDAPLITEFDPDLPEDLDGIFLAALSTDRSERHSDILSLAEELMPYLGDPGEGRIALAEAVVELIGDDEDVAPASGLGAWDRLAHLQPAIGRILGACAGGWLGYVGLASLV
ncbi:MAG: serine/threonine-protein kinase, partial [Actinomycetota bacterium]|nr:serine/threonine-protein kinase [Actinomycetota bacterium]